MSTNDSAHASIAASLVIANLAFGTPLTKLASGELLRTFRLEYKVRGRDCVVTGYVGGTILIVLGAIRVQGPLEHLVARRHELQDFIVERAPMVRLVPHPFAEHAGDENVIWVEVALPLPPGGAPIEPWLAVTPFAAVAGAIDVLTGEFADVVPTEPHSLPLRAAERSLGEPANVSPPEPLEGVRR